MFVSIRKAARLLGVAKSTLRRWDNYKSPSVAFRTMGGHRRHSIITLLQRTQQLLRKEEIKEKNERKESTSGNVRKSERSKTTRGPETATRTPANVCPDTRVAHS